MTDATVKKPVRMTARDQDRSARQGAGESCDLHTPEPRQEIPALLARQPPDQENASATLLCIPERLQIPRRGLPRGAAPLHR